MINSFFLGSIIPLVMMIVLLKKQSRIIMMFFAWGLVAFLISYYANTAIIDATGLNTAGLSVSWAPIIEEFFKALPLLYFAFFRKTHPPLFHYAMASGIGFAIQENYLYLVTNVYSLVYIVVRSVTTCLMHGMTTAMIGYGISLIDKSAKGYYYPFLFGLFTFSVIFHTLYNLYINSNAKILGLLMAPLFYLVGYLVLNDSKKVTSGGYAK